MIAPWFVGAKIRWWIKTFISFNPSDDLIQWSGTYIILTACTLFLLVKNIGYRKSQDVLRELLQFPALLIHTTLNMLCTLDCVIHISCLASGLRTCSYIFIRPTFLCQPYCSGFLHSPSRGHRIPQRPSWNLGPQFWREDVPPTLMTSIVSQDAWCTCTQILHTSLHSIQSNVDMVYKEVCGTQTLWRW